MAKASEGKNNKNAQSHAEGISVHKVSYKFGLYFTEVE